MASAHTERCTHNGGQRVVGYGHCFGEDLLEEAAALLFVPAAEPRGQAEQLCLGIYMK